MLKDFLLVRAAPNLAAAEVCTYLQHKHAPLALTVPTTARLMRRYTMNHVIDSDGVNCCIHPSPAGLASVVEHELGGEAGINAIMADRKFIAEVVPDEKYMIENLMDGVPEFISIDEELVIFDTGSSGSLRMFDFIRRREGLSRNDFLVLLAQDAERACEPPGYKGAVTKRVHSLPGAEGAPFGESATSYDAVIEVWIGDVRSFANLVKSQREHRQHFSDFGQSMSVLTRENRIR